MKTNFTSEEVRRMHEMVRRFCANLSENNCLLLDDGETHPCVQLNNRSSIACNYFREAVLPEDKELYELLTRPRTKVCACCGSEFLPQSNRQKYCPNCREEQYRRQDAYRKYLKRHPALFS